MGPEATPRLVQPVRRGFVLMLVAMAIMASSLGSLRSIGLLWSIGVFSVAPATWRVASALVEALVRLRAAALAVAFGLRDRRVHRHRATRRPGARSSRRPWPVPSPPEVPSPTPKGPDSAVAAAERLCEVPEPDLESGSEVQAEGRRRRRRAGDAAGRADPRVRYSERVVAEPVLQEEIGRDLLQYADIAYTRGAVRAGRRMGPISVIPDGTSLQDACEYGSGQVIEVTTTP